MNRNKFNPLAILLLLCASMVITSNAVAASYSKLTKDGYKTGKLTKNVAGLPGWYLVLGTKRYFCTMRSSLAYVGKTGMVGFTTSGKQIGLNRKVYDSKTGGFDKNIPQLSNLKSGKLKPAYVRSCRLLK